jgi:hypothetical protein
MNTMGRILWCMGTMGYLAVYVFGNPRSPRGILVPRSRYAYHCCCGFLKYYAEFSCVILT